MHDHASLVQLAVVIRTRRAELGLKQADLAELAGCSPRFVHTVEAGKATVRMDKLMDLLQVLGLGLRLVREPGVTVDSNLAGDRR